MQGSTLGGGGLRDATQKRNPGKCSQAFFPFCVPTLSQLESRPDPPPPGEGGTEGEERGVQRSLPPVLGVYATYPFITTPPPSATMDRFEVASRCFCPQIIPPSSAQTQQRPGGGRPPSDPQAPAPPAARGSQGLRRLSDPGHPGRPPGRPVHRGAQGSRRGAPLGVGRPKGKQIPHVV